MAAQARRPRVRITVGAAVLVFLLAAAVAVLLSTPWGGSGSGSGSTLSGRSGTPSGATGMPIMGTVYVHVIGAVARPGLVALAAGTRVIDAIAAAGGMTAEADRAGLNLAERVTDGQQLRVPRVGEAGVKPGGNSGGGDSGGGTSKINVNQATVAELDTLPRIGPALAQRIIDYRTANGPFRSLADLGKVAGIGDALLDGLRTRVVF